MSKKCPNCNAVISEESKFCTECGYSFLERPAGGKKNNVQEFVSQKEVEEASKPINIQIDLSKVNPALQGYWTYFLRTLKSPSKSISIKNSEFGWLQYLTLFLLNSFSMMVLGKTTYYNGSYFQLFLTTFFVQTVYFLIITLTFYILNNYFKKVQISFRETLLQFGGLLTPNILISFFVLILFLLGAYEIATVFVSISLGLLVLIFYLYAFNFENKSKVDSLYLVILSMVIYLVLLLIFTRVFFNLFLEDLIYMFDQGFLYEDFLYMLLQNSY